jgi:glycosyltransferase involved in cell wall biosynthesis
VQSNDLAGWVRTTGKLPIALGLGKALVASRVGEASRVLPDRFLVDPTNDDELVARMAAVIESGIPADWPSKARSLAEQFRRSAVAADLRRFLVDL